MSLLADSIESRRGCTHIDDGKSRIGCRICWGVNVDGQTWRRVEHEHECLEILENKRLAIFVIRHVRSESVDHILQKVDRCWIILSRIREAINLLNASSTKGRRIVFAIICIVRYRKPETKVTNSGSLW